MILKSDLLRALYSKLRASYDKSSVQVDLPPDIADKIMSWGRQNIPAEILHNDGEDTKGFEDEIHFTVFYGINSPDPNSIFHIVKDIKPFFVRLGLITGFLDKPNYDVLKIDVECPEIYKLHYDIQNSVPNENSYPTFAPHVTSAYLQKNKVYQWLGNTMFRGVTFAVDTLIFSSLSGEKIPIKLNSNFSRESV